MGSSAGSTGANLTTYSKVLPVSIRKEISNAAFSTAASLDASGGKNATGAIISSSEQREMIRITITYPSTSYGSMHSGKEIAIRLTNDENPVFYYHFRISESDFPTLKQQQGLLVDFLGFPAQLVSLLDKCDPSSCNGPELDEVNGMRTAYQGGSNGPKFLLVMKVMSSGNTELDIVESNPFKYLCHISLHISPGSDAEVKKYLSDMTTAVKKEYKALQDKYTHLSTTMEADLHRVNTLYESKCSEVAQLKEELHQQTTLLTTKHFQELSLEKEKLIKLQSDLVIRFDNEKVDLERQHNQAVQKLQARVSGLEAEVNSANQVKVNQENALQDATSRLRNCGEELNKLQKEVLNLREQNTRVDYDYHQMKAAKEELQRLVQSLEKEGRKNQETMKRNSETIISLTCDKKRLEEQRQDLLREIDVVKSANRETTAELQKANEIIKKFQDDMRSSHARNKTLSATISEQDVKLEEFEETVDQLRKDLSSVNEKLAAVQKELEEKTDELQKATSTLNEQDAKLTSNENMIAWLNKKLNEVQGLSDLNKFRANLHGGDSADLCNKNKENNAPGSNLNAVDRMFHMPRPPLSRTLTEAPPSNSATARPSANLSAGASPSWLHIYQSTGNTADHDLSSRLEHVSALGAILSSQSQLSKSGRNKNEISEVGEPEVATVGQASKINGNQITKPNMNSSKPPTWARQKSKVTLDNMINKPTFPIWKNK